MPQLQLFLFGPPRLVRDDREVRLTQRKDLALFIYLAVTRQVHHRDALAALFWPESDQKESRAALRRVLHRLRQAVGEQVFEIAQDTVQIAPSANLRLDTRAFQEAISDCKPQDPPLDELPVDCMERLAGAAAQYTGDFLAGFTLHDCPAFDDWQFFEAEGLRQSLARALAQLAHLHQARQEYEPAIAYARRGLSLDPLHEPAHRRLMALYARSGQQSAALRQYEECARLLKEELKVKPEAETISLAEAIRSRRFPPKDPALRTKQTGLEEQAPPRGETVPEQAVKVLPGDSGPQPSYLPTSATPFVGREKELADIQDLISAPDCRLLTLIGPGGMGKTRLAVQAASTLSRECRLLFPDGVYFVPLASLRNGEEILPAAATALGFSFINVGGSLRQQFLDFMRPKRALLLLDNFEHLLDEPGIVWVIDLLAAAPESKLLITSRSRLNIQSEQLFPVGGLDVPDLTSRENGSGLEKEAGSYSALQLFQQSARRVRPEFSLDAANLPHVAHIAELVQGMPLGVELAASWMEVLSPQEIAAEIEASLDFLESDWRDLPERQRSLRAVFEASWKGLSEEEKRIFEALTVFRGGFTRQAAQQVTGATLKALLGLANKSWLQRESGYRSGYRHDYRFGLHELLRQYAGEAFQGKIHAWQETRKRHASFYADFLIAQGEAMKTPSQHQALDDIASDFQNIATAWMVMVEERRFSTLMEMLFGLVNFCRIGKYSLFTELNRLLDAALQAATSEAGKPESRMLEAAILTVNVWLSYIHIPVMRWQKRTIRQAWETGYEQATPEKMGIWAVLLVAEYARQIDLQAGIDRLRSFLTATPDPMDAWTRAFALASLGGLLRGIDNFEAKQRLDEALHLYRSAGDTIECAYTLRLLGDVARDQGDYPESTRSLEEALEVAEASGNEREKVQILWDLGQVLLNWGKFAKAFETFDELQRVTVKTGWKYIEIMALSTYSFEAVRYGDMDQAREKRRQSQEIAVQINDGNGIAFGVWETGEISRVEGDLETACRYYDESLRLFEEAQVTLGSGFYQRGLGDIALERGQFAQAQAHFEECLVQARRERHTWLAAYALGRLGRAKAGLGVHTAARQDLLEGTRASLAIGNPGLAMVSLAGLAGLLLAEGNAADAVKLSAFVQGYYATWRETKRQAAAVLDAASLRLTPEEATARIKEGQEMELSALASGLLDNPDQK